MVDCYSLQFGLGACVLSHALSPRDLVCVKYGLESNMSSAGFLAEEFGNTVVRGVDGSSFCWLQFFYALWVYVSWKVVVVKVDSAFFYVDFSAVVNGCSV